MLKKVVLFIFCFTFTVISYATVQEDSDQPRIGDEVYTVNDSPSGLPFTFGQASRVVDLDTASGLVTVQFDNDDIETHDSSEIYVSEGCLASGMQNFGREICVSQNVFINIDLRTLTGDALIPFMGPPEGVILGINKNTSRIMIQFVESTARLLSLSRPVVYSVNDVTTRGPSDDT